MARSSSSLSPHGVAFSATIFALATPSGPGGRAILRISGNDLSAQLASLGLMEVGRQASSMTCDLHCPGRWPLRIPVRIAWWPAPRSFTGQDVVELHLLASYPLLRTVEDLLLAQGCRRAEPGEFTLRAFLAGKVNLIQAGAIHDLILADAPPALQSALGRLTSGKDSRLHELRDELMDVLAEVEAGLDFADEDLALVSGPDLARRCREVSESLAAQAEALAASQPQEALPKIVLAGVPNAGKSSLFNALCGREQALVAIEAGTTRDWLEVRLELGGIPFLLRDTAGVEATAADGDESTLTRLAQEQRVAAWNEADLLLHCHAVDEAAAVPLLARTEVLPVHTKADLSGSMSLQGHTLAVSARTGQGMPQLRETLLTWLQHRQCRRAGTLESRELLAQAREHADAAVQLLAAARMPELAAIELRQALDALGLLVGAVYSEDLLDRVFSRFCIGK